MSYEIITDSSVNLPVEMIHQYNLTILSLVFRDQDGEFKSFDEEHPFDSAAFYRKMRDENAQVTTSCVNSADAVEVIEPMLKNGSDVLYLGFSSGLSATYQNVEGAMQELREKYPDRKIYSVDTLAASMGEGLLVVHAARMRENGKSIEEVRDWVEENKLHLAHWFTVENLKYLRRGGRISATSAIFGTILDIKPVLHMDDAGKLVPVDKVRGTRAAMKCLLDHMRQTAWRDPELPVFIVHADCPDRAQALADTIRSEFGTKEIVIDTLDLVIGAHSGPGTLSIFFLGDHR